MTKDRAKYWARYWAKNDKYGNLIGIPLTQTQMACDLLYDFADRAYEEDPDAIKGREEGDFFYHANEIYSEFYNRVSKVEEKLDSRM
jgi:hypothetical protein